MIIFLNKKKSLYLSGYIILWIKMYNSFITEVQLFVLVHNYFDYHDLYSIPLQYLLHILFFLLTLHIK